ncbi:transcriptional regulator [Streptomyces guryensis]|uniref:Transcriptional regulator n=1 Tax=Streptomyces guryensis TaxID=2886947 RepID=A0A9Q3VY98_9ACTN|nr:transcriptional regulator [Streptomyces guryensis]MCD9879175.1 transcriptional regulator [Streptomyces guryensis]
MSDGVQDPAALAELRARLRKGFAASTFRTQHELIRAAELGRTTVSQALSDSAPAPSPETVGTLAKVLQLDVHALLDLHADAVGRKTAERSRLGRPINEWDPLDLEIHPAIDVPAAAGAGRGAARLPAYVRRAHDEDLAAVVERAVTGKSAMAVLVGSSSAGKTRACWEAIQPLAPLGWRLWHPFDPTRAEATLAGIAQVEAHTVVWLNEAQHYLGAGSGMGERIAGALYGLLTDPGRGPVLVLGTLWPEYARAYTRRPDPQEPDPHPQARTLLAGRRINVPETFDAAALESARTLASDGDRQIAQALERSEAGAVTQFLAGAPELLHRYRTASPAGHAVLLAAMDARRLGANLPLPTAFLEHAAPDYLTDTEYHALADDWLERALAELTATVHGNLAPLFHIRSDRTHEARGRATASPPGLLYDLADYLEQHARADRARLCPPASFWEAALDHLFPSDLIILAEAALRRFRLRLVLRLLDKAASSGDPDVLAYVAWLNDEWDTAGRLYAEGRASGHPDTLIEIAGRLRQTGDWATAERLHQLAADAGYPPPPRPGVGWQPGAARPFQRAAHTDVGTSAFERAHLAAEAGDWVGFERLYRQDVDASEFAIGGYAGLLTKSADKDELERWHRLATDDHDPQAMFLIAWMLEEAGDQEGAERLARQAAEAGHPGIAFQLGWARQINDRKGADRAYLPAAHAGHSNARYHLAMMRQSAGDREGAEYWLRRACEVGNYFAMRDLASLRAAAGDLAESKRLAQQAADAGDPVVMIQAAAHMQWTNPDEAEHMWRQVADAGHYLELPLARDMEHLWPHGLEPDGTPSAPW